MRESRPCEQRGRSRMERAPIKQKGTLKRESEPQGQARDRQLEEWDQLPQEARL